MHWLQEEHDEVLSYLGGKEERKKRKYFYFLISLAAQAWSVSVTRNSSGQRRYTEAQIGSKFPLN